MAESSTARLEAFSDGVIAVIITIMVLELKVPHENGLAGLRAVLPTLLVYVLSFSFTAIYWINHHYLVSRIERVNPRVLYSNLLFLFSLSLLPFFTAWVLEKHLSSSSVVIYAVSLLTTGFGFLLLRLAVDRSLREAGHLEHESTLEHRKHLASLALYLVSVPTALFFPRLALAILAAVTLVWVTPSAITRAPLASTHTSRSASLHRSREL